MYDIIWILRDITNTFPDIKRLYSWHHIHNIPEYRTDCIRHNIHYTCDIMFSHVWLFVTPWTAAHQASLSITNPWSLLRPMSIKSGMPSNHLILCHPLLLLPSIFPSIRVFPNESVLHSSLVNYKTIIKKEKIWKYNRERNICKELNPWTIKTALPTITSLWNLSF